MLLFIAFVSSYIFLISSSSLYAQTQVIVGVENFSDYKIPIKIHNKYGWSQQLYKASEIGASGLIDAIAFKVINTSPVLVDSQKIYLAEIANSSFDSSGYSNPQNYGATLVYNDTVTISNGWIQLNLQAPFYYSGNKNLVLFYENHSGVSIANLPVFQTFHNIDETLCKYNYDSTFSSAFSANASFYNYRNVIKLNFLQIRNDLAVNSWNLPATGSSANGSMPISLEIKNNGTDSVSSYIVKYSIDNGLTWKSKSITTPLIPSATTNIQFNSTSEVADMSNARVYRCIAIVESVGDLNKYNDTLRSDICICNGSLSGVYTIGKDTAADFYNLSGAIQSIRNCGMSGPITLKIMNGIYNEQVLIDSIPSSITNPIVIESLSGNADDVVFKFDAVSSSSNYIIKITNTDYLALKNISFKSLSNDYANLLYFENSNHLLIESNKLFGTMNILYSYDQTSLKTHNCSDLIIRKNICYSNKYAIYVSGSNSNHISNIYILNNEINNVTSSGIYAGYADNTYINDNKIYSVEKNSNGISLYKCYNGKEVVRNDIDTYKRNISLKYVFGVSSSPFIIANNLLYGSSNGSNDVYIYNCNNLNFDYNTLVGNSLSSSNAVITVRGTNTGMGYALRLRNNIIINKSDGLAINLYAWGNYTIDYNNYYTNGLVFGKYGSVTAATFANFKSLSSTDINSKDSNLVFTATNNVHTNDINIKGAGILLSSISTDFDNQTRSNPPCIGADEFITTTKDAALIRFYTVESTNSTHDISIAVKNMGSTNITAINLGWSIDDSIQNPVTWAGNISPTDSIVIPLGTNTFILDSIYDMKVWIDSANASPDSNKYNDTVSITDYQRRLPGGIYIIGKSDTADFKTLKIAIDRINNVGISGHIIFSIENGIYEGQYELRKSIYTDSNRTVTFQSLSGDSSDVYLTFQGIGFENYLFYIDRIPYIYFKNLSFKRYNSDESTILHLYLTDNIHISSCAFYGIPFINGNSTLGLIYSQVSNHVNIDKSRFYSGHTGINIYGSDRSNVPFEINITDNIINDFFYYGLKIAGADMLANCHVKRNSFLSTNTTISTPQVIRLEATGNIVFSENTIDYSVGLNTTGIHIGGFNPTNNPNYLLRVYNNYIKTSYRGIYAYGMFGVKGVEILYNTLDINISASQASTAIYTSSVTNLTIKNNSFDSQSHLCFQSYYNTNNSPTIFDYNNIFSTANYPININSTNYSFSSYQSGTNQGANSVSTNPVFINQNDCHAFDTILNNAGTPVSGYTTDIDGDIRDSINPDIGADEFSMYANNASVTAINSPMSLSTIGNVPVKISIRNLGFNNLVSDSLHFQLDSGVIMSSYWSGNLAPLAVDSIIFIGTAGLSPGKHILKVWSSMPNGVLDPETKNDTLIVELFAQTMPGIDLDSTNLIADIQYCNDSLLAPITIRNLGDIKLVINSDFNNAPWVHLDSNAQNTIAADDSLVYNLIFSSAGMATATYTGFIRLTTNDLGNPIIVIPCTLIVQNNLSSGVDLGSDTSSCGSFTLDAGNAYSNYLWSNGGSSQTITVTNSGIYSVTTSNTGSYCVSSDTINVLINANPVASISGINNTACTNDTATIILVSPIGGNLTGPVLAGNIFDPSVIGSGSYSYSYSYTDSLSCTDTITQTVNIYSPQAITFSGLNNTYCHGDSSSSLIGNPSGGVFNGLGIVQNSFHPIIAGFGNHNIIYSYNDTNNCTNFDTVMTTVFPSAPIVINGLNATYCQDDTLSLLSGSPINGMFFGNGISQDSFNPTVAGPGNHYVVYSYTDTNSCINNDSIMTTVFSPEFAISIFDYQNQYCSNSATDTISASPSGGLFSGIGMSASIFNPIIHGVGSQYITYSKLDSNQCIISDSVLFIVHGIPNSSLIINNHKYCSNDNPIIFQGIPFGGIFNGLGMTDSTFSPNIASGGYHDIIYVYSDTNNCSDTSLATVLVSEPIVHLGVDTNICGSGFITLNAGLFSSYLWSTGAISQSIIIDSTGIGYNSISVDLTVTDSINCQNFDTINIHFLNCTNLNNVNFEEFYISVYPNPSTGLVNITSSLTQIPSINMQIFNELGACILTREIPNNSGIFNEKVSLENYSKGVYFIRLSTGKQYKVFKIMLQ